MRLRLTIIFFNMKMTQPDCDLSAQSTSELGEGSGPGAYILGNHWPRVGRGLPFREGDLWRPPTHGRGKGSIPWRRVGCARAEAATPVPIQSVRPPCLIGPDSPHRMWHANTYFAPVDFLIVYWMARYHALLPEDASPVASLNNQRVCHD